MFWFALFSISRNTRVDENKKLSNLISQLGNFATDRARVNTKYFIIICHLQARKPDFNPATYILHAIIYVPAERVGNYRSHKSPPQQQNNPLPGAINANEPPYQSASDRQQQSLIPDPRAAK